MAYEPPLYPTSVPTESDFTIIFDDIDMYWAKYHNQYNKEIRATMNELGLLPKGAFASVRARLDSIDDRVTALENA